MNESLAHDVSTAIHYYVRMIIGLDSVFGFRLFSSDVTQFYLQSTKNLMREVFIESPKEFELPEDQILK